VIERLDALYRRTGANLPHGDPLPSHGAQMEGYFWRITDVAASRVIVVLCGVNRHPDGDWATVAIAAEPGGFVCSAVLPRASSRRDEFLVTAGDGAVRATASQVHFDLGDGAVVDFSIDRVVGWPHVLGGGGIFSAVPFLGQYWHPHVLGGSVSGQASIGGERWAFDGAEIYAEKNWGAGFPESWWWGQAQGFARPDVCVAFGGGRLTAGPLAMTVGGAVVRVGDDVIRFAPPLSRVRSSTDGTRWEVTARNRRSTLRLVGVGLGAPHVLPVPLPADRRNVDTDFEFLAAHMTIELTGDVRYSGETHLAGLETGHRPKG
jgi:tocopherol cyclase